MLCLVMLGTLCCRDDEPVRSALEPIEIPGQDALAPISAERPTHPWNVVLISIDTLRADRVSAYGWKNPTSPRIDQLAAEGVLFERAYAHSPKTAESHMSIMTGIYPSAHGVQNFIKSSTPLHRDIPTLASILQAAGYRTEAYTGGGNVTAPLGFGRGFDFYGEYSVYDRDGAAFERTVSAIDRLADSDQPFFLFSHTYKVHDPYAPPRRYLEGFVSPDYDGPIISTHEQLAEIKAAGGNVAKAFWDPVDIHDPEHIQHLENLYDAEIRYTDDRLRRVLDRLHHWGLDRNTLVILLSDHGEEFMDHGGVDHERLYNEMLHVPLIIRFPLDDDAAPVPGSRVEGVVRLIDVLPTVLDYVGLSIPAHLRGESLLPAAADADDLGSRFVLSQWHQANHGSLQVGTWKFYRRFHFAPLFSIGRYQFFYERRMREELYDLEGDPLETENLASRESAISDELKRRLGALEAMNDQFRETLSEDDAETLEMDEETVKQLEALGYL